MRETGGRDGEEVEGIGGRETHGRGSPRLGLRGKGERNIEGEVMRI